MSKQPCPSRRKLPHEVPAWVTPGSRYFLTINCRRRGENNLCARERVDPLLESVAVYERLNRWHMWLLLVMPDHVHMIASFDPSRGIAGPIAAWKGYHARHLNIEWQEGFFEHRLRTADEFAEKMHYVRMNPVRQGLVTAPEHWPHRWERL